MADEIPYTKHVQLGKETFRSVVRAALLRIFNANIRRHYYVKDWAPMADEFVIWLERNLKSLMDQTVEPGWVRFRILNQTPAGMMVGVESVTDGQWKGHGTLNFTSEEWARFRAEDTVFEFIEEELV